MTPPAYRADGAPVARERFYAIACDPRRSVVVEACAGAGKTWMLVSRILRALIDGALPQEILAITFTRKAAGEMRDRLNDWLREFSATAATDAQRVEALVQRGMTAAEALAGAGTLATLHERLLLGGRAVEIRTFHAWFAQLLRAAPLDMLVELGLHPEAELIEDLAEHLPAVHRRFHAALLRDATLRADHATLVAQRGRSQARRWFDAVLERRVEVELADAAGTLATSVAAAADHWPALKGLDHPARVLLGAAWHATLRGVVLALGHGRKSARDAADAIAAAMASGADPPGLFDALWTALFTKESRPRPRKLGAIPQLEAVQQALQDLSVQIHQHEAHLEQLRMVRLSRALLAEYAAYKRQRGLADMADLERCALALLRDGTLSGWVQERLDARVRHLLVDEFQDTSPLQWQALHAWLAAYAGAGGGASGQRPLGVFLVGDPKQSIYRFRRAEPRVFAAAREFVATLLEGQVLECDHTRRNAPEVLEVLNQVFDAARRTGGFDSFRAHTTEVASMADAGVRSLPVVLRPPRASAAGTAAAEPIWRDSLTTPRHEPDEILREREAQAVAAAIRALLDRSDVVASQVLVLCRKRESLRLAARALQALHVPHVAAEELLLNESAEALDLVAVLDALVSPRHRLSLARALRSPLFGASDADLVALARRAGAAGDWWGALTGTVHASPALARARELLLRWQQASRHLPPHDLLDRVVCEGELRARVAACVPPEHCAQALDAIDAVLAQALVLDAGRYATPYGFVRALKRRPIRFTAPSHPDAVQLLTVHGAKGLEADVVFVIDSDPEMRNPDAATLLVEWPVDEPAPSRCAFVYAESRCPASLQALLAEENRARRREELNGLYVAMTRARCRLVFSATEPSRPGGGPSWWEQVAPHAPAWAPVPVDAVAAKPRRATPVLKVLPRWQPPQTARRSEPPPDLDTPATRLGKAVHRVLEWATAGSAGEGVSALADGAAAEFGASAAEVARIAGRVLASPASARFFGGPALRWAGNEVPLVLGGEVQRIDRLVRLDEGPGPIWWVLDYKLQHRPQDLPAYRDQMQRYRAAVRRAQPDETVRCAFITGDGAVFEVD